VEIPGAASDRGQRHRRGQTRSGTHVHLSVRPQLRRTTTPRHEFLLRRAL